MGTHHSAPPGVRLQAAARAIADLPRQALTLLVLAYRYLLSPWLGSSCRFEPTCSRYALDALERHGALRGSLLTTGRLLRCHPWCHGGHDPVPESGMPRPAGLFTRLAGRTDVTTRSTETGFPLDAQPAASRAPAPRETLK